jgi:hypothetical protein
MAMEPGFRAEVEKITWGEVIQFMSQVSFDPDMAAEVFVLAPEGPDRAADSD